MGILIIWSPTLNTSAGALKLSKKALGFTNPNPLVGELIEKYGEIIGQGYHKEYGKNHAEVNAIEDANNNANPLTG